MALIDLTKIRQAPPEVMSPIDVSGMSQPETMQVQQPKVILDPNRMHQIAAMPNPLDRIAAKTQDRLMADYQKDANPYGSPNNHPGVFGKILHGLSTITGGPNRRLAEEQDLEGDVANVEKAKDAQAQQQASTGLTKAQTEHTQQLTETGTPVEITPNMAEQLGAPELVGQMLTPAAISALSKQHGINTTRVATNAATNQTREDIAGINARVRKEIADAKPEQRDDRAIKIMMKPDAERTDDDNAYLNAYDKWIQQTKVAPGIARAQAFGEFRPLQVIDPATGTTHYEFSGNAIRSGSQGTSGIPFRTASKMAAFMTSGRGGQMMTNYRTATDHMDLLRQAAEALGNGDVQSLNRLSNAFKQEFGSSAPTNFNAVKSMLSGELANVAKVTGATDAEISSMKDQINRADSPEQIRGIVETNQDLMDQKAKEMFEQYQSGMQGVPVMTTGGINPESRKPLDAPHTGTPKVGDVIDGYKFKGGNPAVQSNWELVKK